MDQIEVHQVNFADIGGNGGKTRTFQAWLSDRGLQTWGREHTRTGQSKLVPRSEVDDDGHWRPPAK